MKTRDKVLSIIIVLFLIGLSVVPFLVSLEFGVSPDTTQFALNYIGVLFSTFSVVAIILTVYVQVRDTKIQQQQINNNFEIEERNYDGQVLNYINDFFLGTDKNECRSRVWQLMTSFYTGKKVKSELRLIIEQSIMDYWMNSRKDLTKLMKGESFKDFGELMKMLRYFDLISRYDLTKRTANALHFYYVYYRKFFIDFISIYNEEYEKLLTSKAKKISQVKQGWHDLVPRLDEIMAKYDLPVKVDN